MKRFLYGVFTVLALTLSGLPSSAATTNNFTITDFKSQLKLTKNNQDRSVLETREIITAVFPPNQNRGIERAIPKEYGGHPTSVNVVSVTDQNGASIQYKMRSSNGNQVVRIGDPDSYVSGQKTYVITYTQQDVTRFFSDTNRDEFYWDINGTEWKVPVEKVSAELRLTPELAARLTNNLACYQGVAGRNDRCTITRDGRVIRATSVGKLTQAGENMTIAVGFMPKTFAAYQPSVWERFIAIALPIWISLQIFAAIVAIIAASLWWRWVRRTKELGTVIPEYLPPKDASVQTAKTIGDATQNIFAAQLIDLIVRHYLKLYQVKEKSFFKPAEYEVELSKSPQKLLPEEQKFLQVLFGNALKVGDRCNLKKLRSDYKLQNRLSKQLLAASKEIKTSDWMQLDSAKKSQWKRWAIGVIIIGFILLSPGILVLGAVLGGLAASAYRLSDRGLALRRYLAGLKQYIVVAETERLKLLQSPEGAEKVGKITGDNTKQLVKLYEKVLPYAILFGQEKQWGKVLGEYYEQLGSQPDWYSGQTAFNAAVFSSVISDFGATGAYGSSSSSSSGGSTGGGSSGGGGGGGGGGGW